MGGTSSAPLVIVQPNQVSIAVVRNRKEIFQFVKARDTICESIAGDIFTRSKLQRERVKSRRATQETYDREISNKMHTQFCHSGDTAAFGFDKNGQFIAGVIGNFSKGTQSLTIASMAYALTKDWKSFYQQILQLLRKQGKRKLQTDSPCTTSHTVKQTVRELGFKRQKTQAKGTTKAGCVRLVHSLSRWECCNYTKPILLLAKLVKLHRAVEAESVRESVVPNLIRKLDEALTRHVLEFL